MSKSDYKYEQARQLWLYNGVIMDGYSIIDGEVVPDNEY